MPKAILQPITNFNTRDGLFMLAALIALLLSFRVDQIQVNLTPSWRIPIQRDETTVRGKGNRQNVPLPGPLVSDLDGDGLNEIVVVDSRCGLRLFRVRNGVLFTKKVRERGRDRLGLVLVVDLGLRLRSRLRLVEETIIVSFNSHLTLDGVI